MDVKALQQDPVDQVVVDQVVVLTSQEAVDQETPVEVVVVVVATEDQELQVA